jgi:hypothetical protein
MPRLLYTDPKMRCHASGQAFVQVGGKPFYLGKYRSKAAKLAYQAFLERWKAAGRPSRFSLDTEVTINALALAYWREYKSRLSRGELHPLKTALRMMRSLFGKEPAADFSTRKLKLLRQAMVKKGWVRTSINKHIYRIRRTFRWGVTEASAGRGLALASSLGKFTWKTCLDRAREVRDLMARTASRM